MRVRYTTSALQQLTGILNYIANENSEGARNVSKAIDHAAELAAFMPMLGRSVPHRRNALAIIVRPYPYRITYQMRGGELEVPAITRANET